MDRSQLTNTLQCAMDNLAQDRTEPVILGCNPLDKLAQEYNLHLTVMPDDTLILSVDGSGEPCDGIEDAVNQILAITETH